MIRVNSSQIHSVTHDGPNKILYVKFHARGCKAKDITCDCGGGEQYSYPGVTAEEYDALLKATSVGSHFAKYIKHRQFRKTS